MKENLDLAALDELIALTEKSLGSRFAKDKLPNERQVKVEQIQMEDDPDLSALSDLYQE